MSKRRDEILDLIVEWEEAKAAGREPRPEALCRGDSDRASALQRAVRDLEEVSWLNEPVDECDATSSLESGTTTAPTLPPVLAGRYRVELPVGEGGFGRVYRGFDTWLERPVAIKVPKDVRSIAGAELDLCRLEARKVARLRHPGIVPVHDVGRDGDKCFIVSEWIDGTNLATRDRKSVV